MSSKIYLLSSYISPFEQLHPGTGMQFGYNSFPPWAVLQYFLFSCVSHTKAVVLSISPSDIPLYFCIIPASYNACPSGQVNDRSWLVRSWCKYVLFVDWLYKIFCFVFVWLDKIGKQMSGTQFAVSVSHLWPIGQFDDNLHPWVKKV